MQELEGRPFLGAVTNLSRFIIMLDQFTNKNVTVIPPQQSAFLANVKDIIVQLQQVRARSALAAAGRLEARLQNGTAITLSEVRSALWDIEGRFADHLYDIKIFVLNEIEAGLFAPADTLLAFAGATVVGFSSAFPKASFEIEEAAKCIAVDRHTAAVFHCMRATESGIKAFARLLAVPDPTVAAEKNWGVILRKISEELDAKWPAKTRMPGSDGAKMEVLYAQLAAIRNPWRNATMHVETIYAPHEARHIAQCTAMFMLELMKHCDEEGRTPATAPAMAAQVSDPTAEELKADTRA